MEVDWFTVGAQLLNFAILFALLARFLYRPIVDAIDEREARIRERLEEAEQRESEAERAKRKYDDLRERLRAEREERLEEAEREAERRRKKLLEEIREEVQNARSNWYGRLQGEQERFLRDFSERVERQIFAMTRDALEDLADVEVDRKIIDRFVERLETDPVGVLEEMRRELDEQGGAALVRASMRLDEADRERLAGALERALGEEVEVEFEREEDLVAGIELRVGGRRFGWNIRSYLASLRAELDDAMGEAEARERAS